MSDVANGLPDVEPAVETDVLGGIIDRAMEPEPADGDQESDGRSRDEHGRFAPKAAEASKEPAEAEVTAPVQTAIEPADTQPIEAPARWTEADKAKFAVWPRDVQEAVLDRHKAMEADYTRKSQEISEFRRSAEPLVQAVQPFQQYLAQVSQSIGLQPGQMIHGMLTQEYALRTGTPEQKVQALAQIAGEYGVDLAAMSRGEGAQPDPIANQLRQQVQQLTQRLNQHDERAQSQLRQQVSSEITAFQNAKDANGQPKYPHFQRVSAAVGALIASGEVDTLEAAYERLTAPINEAVAAEIGRRQKTADELNSEAIAKAKRAAPVRTSSTTPGGAPKRGLSNILDQNLSDAGYT